MISEQLDRFNQEVSPFGAEVVAISKRKPDSDILEAYQTGHRIFGENKVQELTEKAVRLPEDIEWHFVGHLQRNKVKYIVPFVSLIHAVDSLRLLNSIEKEAAKANRVVPVLLQVHIAKEETKFGLSENELMELVQSTEVSQLKFTQIQGLMGMATNTPDLDLVEEEFKYLKGLFESIREMAPSTQVDMRHLSIGMSNDYKLALKHGATLIRIGTSIFGPRDYSPPSS